MYPAALADALRGAEIEAACAAELGLGGRPDPDLFAFASAEGYTLLTENVADFARIAAEEVAAGHHHPGVLLALSPRFSRRRSGIQAIVAAIRVAADDALDDRVVYLRNIARD
jgi:hypothetical protein